MTEQGGGEAGGRSDRRRTLVNALFNKLTSSSETVPVRHCRENCGSEHTHLSELTVTELITTKAGSTVQYDIFFVIRTGKDIEP